MVNYLATITALMKNSYQQGNFLGLKTLFISFLKFY